MCILNGSPARADTPKHSCIALFVQAEPGACSLPMAKRDPETHRMSMLRRSSIHLPVALCSSCDDMSILAVVGLLRSLVWLITVMGKRQSVLLHRVKISRGDTLIRRGLKAGVYRLIGGQENGPRTSRFWRACHRYRLRRGYPAGWAQLR